MKYKTCQALYNLIFLIEINTLLKEETKKFKVYDHTKNLEISPEKLHKFPKTNLNRVMPKKEIINISKIQIVTTR